MTRRIVIACAAAATRAVALDGDRIAGLYHGLARGDEAFSRPALPGDIYTVRIKMNTPVMRGAFVDLGNGETGLLDYGRTARPLPEGTTVLAAVRRAAIGGKSAVLGLDLTRAASLHCPTEPLTDPDPTVGRRLRGAPEAIDFALYHLLGPDTELVIADRHEVRERLSTSLMRQQSKARVHIDEKAVRAVDLTAVFLDAFPRCVTLPGGGWLYLDETEGGAVADVDLGTAAASSRRSTLNDAVNAAAARALFDALAQRCIGGRVIVDFLPPSSPQEARQLLSRLRLYAARMPGVRCGRLASDGLFDLTVPRSRPSLLMQATEKTGNSLVRQGLRFTPDWQVQSALFEAEQRLASRGGLRLSIAASPALALHFERRTHWAERLLARYGARLTISEDAQLEDGAYDLVER